jgi:hypothetical protein
MNTKFLSEIIKAIRSLGSPRLRCSDDIKMDVKVVRCNVSAKFAENTNSDYYYSILSTLYSTTLLYDNCSHSFYMLLRVTGLVVRVSGYRSIDSVSIPGATRFSEKQWVRNEVHSTS